MFFKFEFSPKRLNGQLETHVVWSQKQKSGYVKKNRVVAADGSRPPQTRKQRPLVVVTFAKARKIIRCPRSMVTSLLINPWSPGLQTNKVACEQFVAQFGSNRLVIEFELEL